MPEPRTVTDEEWGRLLRRVRAALGLTGDDAPRAAEGVGQRDLGPALRADIERHRIGAVLARDTAGLTDGDRRWIRVRAEGNARRAIASAGRAHEVTSSLAAVGIRSLVLKGTPLAVVTTGDPAGRWCGDIDLLVDPERYGDAHRRLLATGWQLVSGPAADPTARVFAWTRWIDNHASYRLEDRAAPAGYLELHWRLGRSMLLDLDFETLWDAHARVDVGGVLLPAPGPDHLHLHVLAHALRHNTERLQWAVDVALLERGLDAEASGRIDELARRYQPGRTRTIARTVVQRLGLLAGDDAESLDALGRRIVRASTETLRTGTTRWSHATGTLAVTGSASGLGRSVANAGTRGLERFRGHLPEALARQVHRLPEPVRADASASLPPSGPGAMLDPVSDRTSLPHRLRNLAHRFGVDVRRWPPPRDPALAHVGLIATAGIDLVLDVGAAGGGYALMLRDRGHRGRIVSCEPLPESFDRLRSASADDSDWQVRRIAVGAAPGTASLQVAGNADSSSLLPMLDAHTAAAPHTATVGTIEVDVTTVDELLGEVARPTDRVLLKLDVQGAESAVLDGTTLDRITAIHLEHSLVELYEGSETFEGLHSRLRDAGFRLVDVSPGFRDPRTSRLLQFDATYLRDDGD